VAYDLDLGSIRPYIHPDGIRLGTGIKSYRIIGKDDYKEVSDPLRAEGKALTHAEDFISNREKRIEHLASFMDCKLIIVAPYDAELFSRLFPLSSLLLLLQQSADSVDSALGAFRGQNRVLTPFTA
jgi:predicted glycosyl hydrolase (DUF1957 family)